MIYIYSMRWQISIYGLYLCFRLLLLLFRVSYQRGVKGRLDNSHLYNYTLNFPYFSRFPKPFISENQLFSLISSLMRLKQGKLFNYHPQPYPRALRKSVLPLWLHGHIHSLWYSHLRVQEVPVRLWGQLRLTAGCWYKCAVTCENENLPIPLPFFLQSCIRLKLL